MSVSKSVSMKIICLPLRLAGDPAGKKTDKGTVRDFHHLLSALSELPTPERRQEGREDKEKRSLYARNTRSG